jgi:fibronectin type 3 domain-containing protein
VVGDRIVISLPLAATFPEVPEAHYLAVRTVAGGDDRSEMSNQAVIVPRPPPPAPQGLTAEAGPGGVRLAWQPDGPAVIGYDVYRRGAQERTFLDPIGRLDAGASGYFDETARFGERYIYAVTAVAARQPAIASAIGSTVEVDYRDRFPPAAPGGLVALVEEGRVRLAWEAAQAADLAGYRVTRASGGGAFQPVAAALVTASEWVDESVAAGTTYTWRVESVDQAGNASPPAEVTAEAR